MSIIGIDPQAIGWRDDGTEGGVLRTEPVGGNPVPLPIIQGQHTISATGSTASYQAGLTYNPDGSASGINISVPSGNNGVIISQTFYGRAFGVRYQATGGEGPFTVVVDGVAVAVPTSPYYDTQARVITHRDLPEGQHRADIIVAAKASGTASLTLFGWLVDRSAGYQPPPNLAQMINGGEVPTTKGYINYGVSGQQLAAVERVLYANPTESELTVTLTYISSGPLTTLTIPAGEMAVFDLGGPVANGRLIQHIASGAGLVHYVIGAV